MSIDKLKAYYEVTQPSIVALLLFTAVGSYAVAVVKGGLAFSPFTLVVSAVAITSASAGCEVVTNYIDRDIDAEMARTRHRPIPSERIYPAWKALVFGGITLAIGSVLSAYLNVVAFLIITFGIFDNIFVYSYWLKRKNPLNIIIGGFSGGAPALFGWAAATGGSFGLLPVLIAAVVVTWIPNHIWNLALYFKEDYEKVDVPMLPVVFDEKVAVRCIVSTVPILFLLTVLTGLVGNFGWIFWAIVIPLGLAEVGGNVYTMIRPSRKNAWRMFKFSSPYLFFFFVALLLDSLLVI